MNANFVHTVLLLLALPAAAQDPEVERCTDAYSDCHDSCALRFGVSTRAEQRVKLGTCIDRCKRTEAECRTRYFETRNAGVEAGALKKDKYDDDLRDDNRRREVVPEAKEARPPKSREAEPEKRTATKAAELDAPKREEPAPKHEAAPAPAAAAAPEKAAEKKDEAPREAKKAPEPVKEKKRERSLDEWDPEAL